MLQRPSKYELANRREGGMLPRDPALSPSPPVLWWGCGTVPLPPCGVVGVWYGMLGMYVVYGLSGLACLESMVCLVCMVGVVYMA